MISHGTTPDAEKWHEWTPYVFYRQGIEFARRGFAALVVMRRGYGSSGRQPEARSAAAVFAAGELAGIGAGRGAEPASGVVSRYLTS